MYLPLFLFIKIWIWMKNLGWIGGVGKLSNSCSWVSKKMEVCCVMSGWRYWEVQLSSSVQYSHFTAWEDRYKSTHPPQKNPCGKVSSSQEVFVSDQENKSIFLADCGDPALERTSGVYFPCKWDVKAPTIQDNPVSGAHWFLAERSELKWWVTDLFENEQPPQCH